ncbi:hypothetical protein [Paraburkholderia sp. BR14320]|uniref:hypothetical protein n=1 Tax=unclassified Paraburkholderia TaxID=2615204 RepID=UPI0034CE2D34
MKDKPCSWDKAKRARLRSDYNAARATGAKSFLFDGSIILVAYAQYLIACFDRQVPKTCHH